MKYKDLGEIIAETDVADGAFAWSDTIYNCVRFNKMIFKCKSTKSYELYIKRIDSTGVEDWSSLIINGLGATAGSYAGIVKDDTSSIIGYAFQIGVKNTAGDASTADFNINLELKE